MEKQITKEYLELFSAVEDAISSLEKIRLALLAAQIKAEDIFVAEKDEEIE